MLGLGRKCSLGDACAQSGVPYSKAHHAAADALAAAALWQQYLRACERSGVRTFAQRAELRDYKFTSIFDDALLDGEDRIPLRSGVVMKSRATALNAPLSAPSSKPSGGQLVLAACWDALTAAIADLDITPYEIFYLKAKQNALGVRPEELRWMHARAFSGVLADMCQDKAITDEEAALSGVADALRELGWAPGDEPSASVVL